MIMILSTMITILIFRSKSGIIAFCLLTVALLGGCSGQGNDEEAISIVATTSIWGDVASHIVGDAADVEVLIPRNADAHDFQITSQQAASLIEADLVIANGLGLEEGLHDVLESAESDGVNILEVAPLLDPLPFASHEHEDDDDHAEGEEGHGEFDPHVWFDPQRVAIAADAIASELIAIDPSVDWQSRVDDYARELAATDAEIQTMLSDIPADRRDLVTNHEALGYFAERYGFEIIGVVIPGGSTLGDPSSAELAELVETIETHAVDVIFTETSEPGSLAEAVAAEVGREVSVVVLFTESLGEEGTDAGTLTGLRLNDARLIADALG